MRLAIIQILLLINIYVDFSDTLKLVKVSDK